MNACCPRCHYEEARTVYDYGQEQIVRCGQCDLMFLHPWPAHDAGDSVYNETYFQNSDFFTGQNANIFGYVDYISERFNKQPQFARIAREIRSLLISGSGGRPRLLEIGCGFGYFLEEAFEEGFDPAGVEFNPSAVGRLRRKYSFPIVGGALEDVTLEEAAFDAVAMFDVIEHLRDPFQSLDKIHQALKPGGLLVISTPDAGSLVSRLIGKNLEDFRRTREHLFFFSRRSLEEILDEHGFELLRIRSIGHTFALGFLLERMAIYSRPVIWVIRKAVALVGLAQMQIHLNPHTKMIAVARRRPVPVTEVEAREGLDELDQTLMEELEKLENAVPQHYRWVFDMIAPHLGRSVLEIGSGIGVFSKFMLSDTHQLMMTDHQEAYLTRLRHRFGELPHLKYQILDLNTPPFDVGDSRPDTILCLNVLEHIKNDEAALAGLAALLEPGGRLILQVPNHPVLYGSLDRSYGHYRRYTTGELKRKLERAGFRLLSFRSFNPWSVPGWFLMSRALKAPALNTASLKTYDRLVPLFRSLGPLSHLGGLSLIAVAEKSGAPPGGPLRGRGRKT